MECLSLASMALAPARSPSNPFRERLECSEGGNTGRRARRPCHWISNIRRESLRPSVQLPAGGERKAGFIGLFREKARIGKSKDCGTVSVPLALQQFGQLDREVGPFLDMAGGLG